MKEIMKLLLEMGPLILFFVVNQYSDIFAATAGFMAATVVSLALSRWLYGRIPVMPLITGIFVLGMGGITLYLQDPVFIKMKPTITNTLFAVILLGCLPLRILIWQRLFGDVFALSDRGWFLFQLAWGLYFVLLAILNEIVWRSFSTDIWVAFKTFGLMPLTFLFMLALWPLWQKHRTDKPAS